ncbi:MAG TPA: hypothetical protein VKP30_14185 [Polyangiaceae bacterium]|nr:hypothetical protein [Polyangiaceae bacterium]
MISQAFVRLGEGDGESGGTVRDPFGHEWLIVHSIESVSPEEMQARYTKFFAST